MTREVSHHEVGEELAHWLNALAHDGRRLYWRETGINAPRTTLRMMRSRVESRVSSLESRVSSLESRVSERSSSSRVSSRRSRCQVRSQVKSIIIQETGTAFN